MRYPSDRCGCEQNWRDGKGLVRIHGQVIKQHDYNCDLMEKKYGPFDKVGAELQLAAFVSKRRDRPS